ncbi:DM13 domain-containing protein [Shewanella sp. 202IG2-18]|uniref:DM13 domain-containing protein n=1 Tax=Parashewanella hymeniacidonis TaxID=2807618 RepID=UPI00195F3EE1|nr:DM13 domain-containing protein [Parashewanella hymeniacidonis]MBM7072077.1 DM13 domain-containing protein [Parashewanella hymeniacidonis]
MKKKLLLLLSHLLFGIVGFAVGIYALPILTASKSPSPQAISSKMSDAKYTAEFKRSLTDSDLFHWGDGLLSVSERNIAFKGKLAPGPDYRLYLSPKFVDTEVDFKKHKHQMTQIASINSFNGFIVNVPEDVNISEFNSVIIWCETFGEFITAAKYKQ